VSVVKQLVIEKTPVLARLLLLAPAENIPLTITAFKIKKVRFGSLPAVQNSTTSTAAFEREADVQL